MTLAAVSADQVQTRAVAEEPSRLSRQLGLGDAVFIALGSMIGAGVFAALSPAAVAAGTGLMVGLFIAGAVAYCNATSSARLAARYPESGGTYVYGRERLGHFWGHLAGWGFVVGKTASCAAIALTFGHYAAPQLARPLAVTAVVALSTVNHFGVRRTTTVTKVMVLLVLVALALVVFARAPAAAHPGWAVRASGTGWRGVLESAGLLFFAFAGYARIATLGEEVKDPARTIPRAVPIALGITLVVYAAVAYAALASLGPDRLAQSAAPLVAVVEPGSHGWAAPAVRGGAALACLGVLLSLLAGVGRTVFAMADGGDLPRRLAAVHPRYRVPHLAGIAVAGLVVVAVLLADLRGALGFSSFCVLVYYAVANSAAWTLREGQVARAVAVAGLAGCLVLAFTLPGPSVLAGLAVLVVGVLVRLLTPGGEGRAGIVRTD